MTTAINTTVSTNAANTVLASDLAAGRASATFTGIVIRLTGSEYGPKGAKVRVGDALVHDTIVSGFKYRNLKDRDIQALLAVTLQDLRDLEAQNHEAWDRPRAKAAKKVRLVLADYQDALKALLESANKSYAGTNESTTDHVYEPLVVDGELVRGCRVYVGHATDPSKNCAEPGTVYLQGLRVGRRVLEQPENGWSNPNSRSGVAATAKKLVSRLAKLPSKRYVSYKLDPKGEWVLNLGGAAAAAADADDVTVDPVAVDAVRAALAS